MSGNTGSDECKSIIQLINESYEAYALAKGTDSSEHARALRNAIDSIPLLYIEYLDAKYCNKYEPDQTIEYSIGEAWEACFAKGNMIAGLLQAFDPAKGSFFVLLDKSTQLKIGSISKRNKILDWRMGMKPFTREKERTLSRLLRYAGENGIDLEFWAEEDYRAFCRNTGTDESEWREVAQLYQTNQNIYAIRSSSRDEGDEGIDLIELGWSRDALNSRPVEEEVFGGQADDRKRFQGVLLFLDERLYPQLTQGKKRMWPDLFTLDYSEQHIHSCRDKISKSEGAKPTIADLFQTHFDYMEFPTIREDYGNEKYLFVRDWILAYILDYRRPLKLSDLAEKYYQCSPANLSKEKSLMHERIKKSYTMRNYG